MPIETYTTILITGASSGIGKELAYSLSDRCTNLILFGRNELALKKIKNDLSENNHVEIISVDFCGPEGRACLTEVISSRQPDLLIHSAGFGLYGPAIDHSIDESLRMVQLHDEVSVLISIEGAKALVKNQKRGTIVLLSSAAGFFPYPFFSIYSASKAFVAHFAKCFDREVTSYGIRVLASCPGMVSTSFRKTAAKGKTIGATPFDMTPEKAVKNIIWQIDKKKTVYVFDWRYRLFVLASKILPSCLLEKVLIKSIKSRY